MGPDEDNHDSGMGERRLVERRGGRLHPRTEVASTMTTQAAPTVWVAGQDPEATTLYQYIVDNKIAEVRFKPWGTGHAEDQLSVPPDWKNAGTAPPIGPTETIVYDKAQNLRIRRTSWLSPPSSPVTSTRRRSLNTPQGS